MKRKPGGQTQANQIYGIRLWTGTGEEKKIFIGQRVTSTDCRDTCSIFHSHRVPPSRIGCLYRKRNKLPMDIQSKNTVFLKLRNSTVSKNNWNIYFSNKYYFIISFLKWQRKIGTYSQFCFTCCFYNTILSQSPPPILISNWFEENVSCVFVQQGISSWNSRIDIFGSKTGLLLLKTNTQ